MDICRWCGGGETRRLKVLGGIAESDEEHDASDGRRRGWCERSDGLSGKVCYQIGSWDTARGAVGVIPCSFHHLDDAVSVVASVWNGQREGVLPLSEITVFLFFCTCCRSCDSRLNAVACPQEVTCVFRMRRVCEARRLRPVSRLRGSHLACVYEHHVYNMLLHVPSSARNE